MKAVAASSLSISDLLYNLKALFQVVFILLLLATNSLAVYRQAFAKEMIINDHRLFEYANFLYKKGEFYRAVTEYKRLLYFFPESENVTDSKLQIGRSYMAGQRYEDAIAYWKKQLTENAYEPSQFEKIKTLLGIALLDKDQIELFKFRENSINKAFGLFSTIPADSDSLSSFSDFTEEWQNRELSNKKSPWIAGTLSVFLPGAGSFYSGRYMEGLYSFFLTGLFFAATQDSLANNRDDLGLLFGFLTMTFYGGNIYTSINGAHKLNDKAESDELMRLRQKYGVWFIPATESHPGRY